MVGPSSRGSWLGLVLFGNSYALNPPPEDETPQRRGLMRSQAAHRRKRAARSPVVLNGTVSGSPGRSVVWAGDLRVDPITKKGGNEVTDRGSEHIRVYARDDSRNLRAARYWPSRRAAMVLR